MKLKPLIKTLIVAIGFVSLPVIGFAQVHGNADSTRSVASDSIHQTAMANIVNRNQDNTVPDPTTILNEWYKFVTISGAIEPTLATGFGSRPFNGQFPGFNPDGNPISQGPSGASQALFLNTATIYIDAQVMPWILAHTTLSFDANFNDASSFSSENSAQPQTAFIEEATITLANFESENFLSPLWMTAGRQFLLFGSYAHTSIGAPITQVLSSANTVAITAGYISETGLNADIYGFGGAQPEGGPTNLMRGFGANVGLNRVFDTYGYNLNLGFLNNLASTFFIANSNQSFINTLGFVKAVGGLSFHGDFTIGKFSANVDYVTALTRFDPQDLPAAKNYNGYNNNPTGVPDVPPGAIGALPWGISFEGTYNFVVMDFNSKVFAGYQQSGDAVNVTNPLVLNGFWTPQYRGLVGAGINFSKNLMLRLQYQYDVDYSTSNGGTGKNNNTLLFDLKLYWKKRGLSLPSP